MRIVFAGAGAVGSTALWFCRNLDGDIVVIDFDRVESRNLLAQVFTRQAIGKNKAEASKLQLKNYYGKNIEAFGVRLVKENIDRLCESANLLVDAFDNADSRRLLSQFARSKQIPLVHAAMSADATFAIVRWDERFEADVEDTPGQATCEGGDHLPFVGVLGATLARIIQDFVTGGLKRDAMIDLRTVRGC